MSGDVSKTPDTGGSGPASDPRGPARQVLSGTVEINGLPRAQLQAGIAEALCDAERQRLNDLLNGAVIESSLS